MAAESPRSLRAYGNPCTLVLDSRSTELVTALGLEAAAVAIEHQRCSPVHRHSSIFLLILHLDPCSMLVEKRDLVEARGGSNRGWAGVRCSAGGVM